MGALAIDPHGDDISLFCAFGALSAKAHVVCVLRSQIQEDRYGITAATREAETAAAMKKLGLTWEQWPWLDTGPGGSPVWERVLDFLEEANIAYDPDPVFAPAVEDDGHSHHSEIGKLAVQVFGDRVIPYLTYTRTNGRSRNGTEVVPEPDWIVRKHRALACYRSQIEEPSCRPWFLGDLREWVA